MLLKRTRVLSCECDDGGQDESQSKSTAARRQKWVPSFYRDSRSSRHDVEAWQSSSSSTMHITFLFVLQPIP